MGNYFVIYVIGSVLLLTLLALNVSRLRRRLKIGSGDGGNKQLYCAIRSHANAFEQIMPFFLLVLALSFKMPGSVDLFALVCVFLVVRVFHAWSLLKGILWLRTTAASVTYLLQCVGIVIVIGIYFF